MVVVVVVVVSSCCHATVSNHLVRDRMESTASLLYAVMLRRSCSHLLIRREQSIADRACGAGRYLGDEVMGGEVMRGRYEER